MVFVNRYILISILVAFGFFYSLLLFLSDYEENKCEMTYMFQYPQFVRISLEVDKHLKKYGLYSYSEGQYTEKARKMNFNGIPVLFIPGNAGSYKQVRSLASVALRKALDSRPGFYFDYFTIDFNEELSGLNGALLYDQINYAKHSIYRILELYALNKDRPTSVVLIGHSMGGLVAEGLLSTLPNNNIISLVITLASPHKRPSLYFDIYLYNFYKKVETWDNKMNTTFITVFGGFNDFLVPPHLTNSKHLSVVTTNVPRTWLPTDHLCILWCKQLVLVLNRALFDSVDLETKQISQDKEYIISVFKHYLLHNSGIRVHLRKQYDLLTPIDNGGKWIEYLPRQYSVQLLQGIKQTQWYMVRLVKQPLHEMLTILSINLEVTNWIFVCSARTFRGQSRVCVDAMHLSHLSEIVPSIKYKRRFLNINLHQLSDNFTHVVAKIPPTSDSVVLHVDVHSEADRKIVANLPSWSLKNKIIIDETSENALYYELHFPELNHITQSYQLFVEPKKCKAHSHHATATLSVPWSNLDYHVIFTESQNKPMNLRLYSMKPPNMTNSSAFVKLILDPNCRYSVSVKVAVPNMIGQFARFYSPFIFANIAVVVLLVFRSQLNSIGTKGRCSLFFSALMTDTKPYYIIPVAKVSLMIFSSLIALKILPIPDTQILDEEGIGFISTITLYISSIGIVWLLTVILAVSIFCFESTINKIALKLIPKSAVGTTTTYDWLLKALKKFPAFAAFALLIVTISTCGGLALCLGLIFYFFKLTQMAQDVIENIVKKLIKAIVRKLKIRPDIQQKIEQFMLQNTQRETKDNERNKRNISDQKYDVNNSKSNTDSATTSGNEVKNIERNESSSSDETSDTKTDKATSNDLLNSSLEDNKPEDDTSLFAVLQEVTENNELYFHFTVFCLWFLVTCINIPIVLTWAQNFKYSSKLYTDPSFIPGFILSTCAIALWQFEYPKAEKKWYTALSYIIYIIAVFCWVYGVVSLYRLNYALSSVIALVTLHQLLAPKKIDTSENDNSQPEDKYEKVKAKWE